MIILKSSDNEKTIITLLAVLVVILAAALIHTVILQPDTGTAGTETGKYCSASPEMCRSIAKDEYPAVDLCRPEKKESPESEEKETYTITLTRPDENELVPYDERGFSAPEEASVAWWMCPGYGENTSEYRSYQRKSPEKQSEYPDEQRLFFNFITYNLDSAEEASVIKSSKTVYRGIPPGLSEIVISNSEYSEPAFASTSYDISFCIDAFCTRGEDGYKNVIIAGLKEGDHALYINEDEREFLLPRGSDWTVTKVTEVDNLTVKADFPLYSNAEDTDYFEDTRLIYISENIC